MTNHQEKTFKELLESEDKIVMLTGSGGVGKTYCINEFLNETHLEVQLCATTHKALTHYDCEGKTIHSFLGYTIYRDELVKRDNAEVQSVDIFL